MKIVAPSSPYEAKGLMATAIYDGSPVLFIEHKELHEMKGEVPEEDYTIPIGKGVIRREGTDVTIVAVGTCRSRRWKQPKSLPRRASPPKCSTRAA